MKKYLQFLLSFLLISLVLYIVQQPLIYAYQSVLLMVMSLFTGENFSYFYDSSFRLIMLVALLLATPGVHVKRRFLFALYGLLSLWAIDLISFAIWTIPPPLTPGTFISQPHMIYSLIWRMMGHWVLPFMLWLILVREHIADWFAQTAAKK